MIELPPATPGRQVMPMMAPDVRYAFCRFDLANGPVRLNARVADELWLIALYTPEGENFYSVAGADMKRAEIDLVIAAADQTVEEASVDAPEIVRRCHRRQLAGHGRNRSDPGAFGGSKPCERAERALKATSCGPYTKSG